jgi:lipoate-protein ligase A
VRDWLFLREARCPAGLTMRKDLDLFDAVRRGTLNGALRIYNWSEPAVTIGHHQKSFSFFDRETVLPVLRRPTGGGAVLHVDDITFSLCAPLDGAIPPSIPECSRTVSALFASALGQSGVETATAGGNHAFSPVCFERPTPQELVASGSKILGLALARTGRFMLVQGVLPMRVDRDLARRVFGPGPGAGTRGIMDLCGDFCVEEFLLHLRQAFSLQLGVLFSERGDGDHHGREEDQCTVEPG